MRGVSPFPDERAVANALHELATKPFVGSVSLVQYSQWARLDPRVAEAVTRHLGSSWSLYSPIKINKCLRKGPWPAAMGVLLEFAQLYLVPSRRRTVFGNWASLVMHEIRPTGYAQFFYGLRKFAGHQMFDDARLSAEPYLKWGFLGRDILVKSDVAKKSRRPLWSKDKRMQILTELLRQKKRITIRDYLDSVRSQISVRQAERDLKSIGIAKVRGRTKDREYLYKGR